MTFISLTRFRWKTVVLSFAIFYAVYFFSALANVSDRRDILLQSVKGNTAQTLGVDTYQNPKESISQNHNENTDHTLEQSNIQSSKESIYQKPKDDTDHNLEQSDIQSPKENIYQEPKEDTDHTLEQSNVQSPKDYAHQNVEENSFQSSKESPINKLNDTTDQTVETSVEQSSTDNEQSSQDDTSQGSKNTTNHNSKETDSKSIEESTHQTSEENTSQSLKGDTEQSVQKGTDQTSVGVSHSLKENMDQNQKDTINSGDQIRKEEVNGNDHSLEHIHANTDSSSQHPLNETNSTKTTIHLPKQSTIKVDGAFKIHTNGSFPIHTENPNRSHEEITEDTSESDTINNSDLILAASWPRPHNGSNPPIRPDVDEYVAFCVAVKDQSRDLPEFLMHHYYNMGVGRFYIMDDGSNPPLSAFRGDYGVPESVLTFDYKPFGKKKVQFMQYALDDRCIKMHGNGHTWMGFIDADEFIETRGNDTLIGILEDLDKQKHVGALGINWRIHTSAGLLTRPESSRKEFTECIGDVDADDGHDWMDNKGIKSIVKVKSYKLPMNPHQFYLKNGQKTVGEHGDILPYGARRTPISRDRIGLHHYAIKSLGEFEEKMTRWSAKGWGYWEHIERYRVLKECKEMQKYEI